MARDLEPVRSDDTESESEEEESEEDASSESDSDSEPDQNTTPKKAPPAAQKSISQSSSKVQKEQVKEESDSDSVSGSDTESDGPGPNALKKPNDAAAKTKPDPVTPIRSSGVKRPAEEKGDGKESKKSKTKPPETEDSAKKSIDDPKKQLFQRLWSEDDEIVILKGMIDYSEKKKSDPITDLNAFHSFIKENLHVDVSRTQLQDKIRRLKKKYANNKSKEKEGKGRTFSKPHEQKAYELSKHIWGSESVKDISPKSNGTISRNTHRDISTVENGESEVANASLDRIRGSTIMRSHGVSIDHERIYRIGSELFDGKKGIEGGKEWSQLMLEEMELHMKMLELMRARTKLVIDLIKSNNR